jgi:selenocysteine lyase/cysteine desulfurase
MGLNQAMTVTLSLADAVKLWDRQPGFLNTGNYGLPPRPAFEALRHAEDQWRRGEVDWPVWTVSVEEARREFGRIIGVHPDRIATGVAVSQLLAPVAAAVPDGGVVLVPDLEFTSAVFPFAVHEGRGVSVRTAPLAEMADSIRADIDVVALAPVQSATGEIADLRSIADRAREVGAVVVADATHAASWIELDDDLIDIGVAAAYKWLCSPRGTAFQWFADDLADRHPQFTERLLPLAAGWFAGPTIHSAYYGMPLRLADNARRFDISPAWHCWVGAAPALQILADVGSAAIGAHNIDLGDHLLEALGLPARGSAIVSVDVADDALERLRAANVRFAVRDGRARFAFHLYNTREDAEAVAALLEP